MVIPTLKVKTLSGVVVIINEDEVVGNPLYASADSKDYDFVEVKPKTEKKGKVPPANDADPTDEA